MWKLLILLMVLTGCEVKYVYVKPPKIQVVPRAQGIDINVSQHCMCNDDVDEVFALVKQLRKSEEYYIEAITTYNESFTEE